MDTLLNVVMGTKRWSAWTAWLGLLVLALGARAGAKRVIMLPMPFESNIDYHDKVARALTKLGHEVWMTVPVNLAEKDRQGRDNLSVVLYDTPFDIEERTMPRLPERYFQGLSANYDELETIMKEHCERILKNHTFFKTLQHIRPDFVVIDNLSLVYELAILPYKLGVPFAFVGSSYAPIAQRVPSPRR